MRVSFYIKGKVPIIFSHYFYGPSPRSLKLVPERNLKKYLNRGFLVVKNQKDFEDLLKLKEHEEWERTRFIKEVKVRMPERVLKIGWEKVSNKLFDLERSGKIILYAYNPKYKIHIIKFRTLEISKSPGEGITVVIFRYLEERDWRGPNEVYSLRKVEDLKKLKSRLRTSAERKSIPIFIKLLKGGT